MTDILFGVPHPSNSKPLTFDTRNIKLKYLVSTDGDDSNIEYPQLGDLEHIRKITTGIRKLPYGIIYALREDLIKPHYLVAPSKAELDFKYSHKWHASVFTPTKHDEPYRYANLYFPIHPDLINIEEILNGEELNRSSFRKQYIKPKDLKAHQIHGFIQDISTIFQICYGGIVSTSETEICVVPMDNGLQTQGKFHIDFGDNSINPHAYGNPELPFFPRNPKNSD